MAENLTRPFLRSKGIEDETLVQEIIDAHMESVTPLKAYRGEAERLARELSEAQAQLKAANEKLEAASKDDYKEKYEALVKENQQKEVRTAKENALKGLLDELGISDKGKALAVKYIDFDTIELDPANKMANAAAVKEAVLADWGDYKQVSGQSGATVANPPAGNGGAAMTKEQIMAIPDRAQRREAIARNQALFTGVDTNKS